MKTTLCGLGILTLAFCSSSTPRAQAVTYCHDYALHRVSDKKVDPNKMDVAGLRKLLQAHGYKSFPFTTAAERPDAMRHLKPGDVVILGNAHSGFVGESGIDHFLMVEGRGQERYLPEDLPVHVKGLVGGLHQGDTITQFKNRGSMPFTGSIEVWRKVK